MKRNNNAANYLTAVKKQLQCPKPLKKAALHALESDLAEYVEEHPKALLEDIIRQFGEPEEFAKEVLSALDEAEIHPKLQKSKWIVRTILITLIVIGIIFIAMIIGMVLVNDQPTVVYHLS